MLEWLITSLLVTGIGEAVKASDRRKYKPPITKSPVMPPKPSVRYQNKGKQMMYEVYLKDLRENPQWAAYKVKHNGYGGYVFDDTEV